MRKKAIFTFCILAICTQFSFGQKMPMNDMLDEKTLVWKVGMANWLPALQVPDVYKLFILAKVK